MRLRTSCARRPDDPEGHHAPSSRRPTQPIPSAATPAAGRGRPHREPRGRTEPPKDDGAAPVRAAVPDAGAIPATAAPPPRRRQPPATAAADLVVGRPDGGRGRSPRRRPGPRGRRRAAPRGRSPSAGRRHRQVTTDDGPGGVSAPRSTGTGPRRGAAVTAPSASCPTASSSGQLPERGQGQLPGGGGNGPTPGSDANGTVPDHLSGTGASLDRPSRSRRAAAILAG